MSWKESEIIKAKELLKNGLSYTEIGEKLNKSKTSIRTKLSRLGVSWTDYNNPNIVKKCVNCNIEFNCKTYKKNKFCSCSCSVTYNNKLRKVETFCINCSSEIKNSDRRSRKYCNHKCMSEHRWKLKCGDIENGVCKTVDTYIYKKYLKFKHGEKCMDCGWNEANPYSNNIPLELHHIDGNPDNNNLNNLELLCPNCHCLKNNWKGIKNGDGRHSRRRKYRRDRYKNGLSH
jgi:hypothetical protein